MSNFFLVLLAGVGMAHILVDGSIMQPFKKKLMEWDGIKDENGELQLDENGEVRLKPESEQRWAWLRKLLACYQCSGFWSGLFVSGLWMLSYLPYMLWLKVFLYACATSYVSMLGAVLLIYFNTQQVTNDKTNGSAGD